MKHLFVFVMSVASVLTASPSASAKAPIKSCIGCPEIKSITQEFETAKEKSEKANDARQLRATAVIQKMAAGSKNEKLDAAQIEALVHLLSVALPMDPAEALIGNNLEIIKANEKEIRAQTKTLSQSKRDRIEAAIDSALGEDEHGNNPAPKR